MRANTGVNSSFVSCFIPPNCWSMEQGPSHLGVVPRERLSARKERLSMLKRCLLYLALPTAVLAVSITPAFGQWGNLTGTLVYDGKAPTPEKASITKDNDLCEKFDIVDESLIVNAENNGIKDAVIYLYLRSTEKPPKAHPDYDTTAKDDVRVDNLNCRFEPQVSLLRTTQTLIVGNKDPVSHNSKIDLFQNQSINPNIPSGREIRQTFRAAERTVMPISCSIHPWMRGFVLIKDHPYMAVTDENGKFEIKNLPVGEWQFQVWKTKYLRYVKVGGKATEWSKGRFKQKIDSGKTADLGKVMVAAKNFD